MSKFIQRQPAPEIVDAYQNLMPLTVKHGGVPVPPFYWVLLRPDGSITVLDDTTFRAKYETIQLAHRLPHV